MLKSQDKSLVLKDNCNIVFVSRNGFDLIVFTLFDLSCGVIRVYVDLNTQRWQYCCFLSYSKNLIKAKRLPPVRLDLVLIRDQKSIGVLTKVKLKIALTATCQNCPDPRMCTCIKLAPQVYVCIRAWILSHWR